MLIPYYQINSFTGNGFTGNPAGVCLLKEWFSEEQMQFIATENNLSETAFVVKNDHDYHIRWYTPTMEVDLCGHATLAAAYVINEHTDEVSELLNFNSRSGILKVRREKNNFIMDFPADQVQKSMLDSKFSKAFPIQALEIFKGNTDYLLVYKSETEIRDMVPDLEILSSMKERGVIVTAPGDNVDFVSRFYAPQSGIPEDPVTGSAHTTLIPYWADRLGKNDLLAWQISERGGVIRCFQKGDRVEIMGEVTLYISGSISL